MLLKIICKFINWSMVYGQDKTKINTSKGPPWPHKKSKKIEFQKSRFFFKITNYGYIINGGKKIMYCAGMHTQVCPKMVIINFRDHMMLC